MNNISAIKLLILDVDGVLTDGSIIVNDRGEESKRFHVRDGFAIRAAMSMDLEIAIITGRATRAVNLRLLELGVTHVLQGVKNKQIGLETICQQTNLEMDQIAYLGDDLIDLPAMLRCGYPMAVGDAVEEVREAAKYITHTKGGRGAVREAVEHLLKQQGRWAELVERYAL